MQERPNTKVVLNNPVLVEMLVFLSDPPAYLLKPPHEQSAAIARSLESINRNHTSVYNDADCQKHPKLEKLKEIFDKLASASHKLLEGKDGMSRQQFNVRAATFKKSLNEVHDFRQRNIPDHTDKPDDGIWAKFFIGQNSLEAVFLGMAQNVDSFFDGMQKSIRGYV